jgi:hypothetical protein
MVDPVTACCPPRTTPEVFNARAGRVFCKPAHPAIDKALASERAAMQQAEHKPESLKGTPAEGGNVEARI